ncbi:MAG: hypothetical protein U0793_16680 [Gemmataceae bacterium]
MKARLLEHAAVLSDRDPAAAALARLERGAEVEAGGVSKHAGQEWREVALADGRKGFLAASAPLIALVEVRLDQEGADVYAEARRDAKVKGRLARNEVLTVLERFPDWCLIRSARLGDGYVTGRTRVRLRDAPELSYARSFWTGATIIGALAAIPAAFLFFRGEQEGAGVLLLCAAVAGGLAGLVFFATRLWREREFGAHLSWGAVTGTYVLGVGLLLYGCSALMGGSLVQDEALTHPAGLSALLAVAVGAALFLGYYEQRLRHHEEERPWLWSQPLLPLLCGVGLLLALGGGVWWWSAEKKRPLALEARTPAEAMTLRQLVANGYAANRYVFLNEFRYADQWIVETVEHDLPFVSGWAILVPGKGDGKKTPVSGAAVAVVATREFKDIKKAREPGVRPLERSLHTLDEMTGMRVMVMNGMRALPRLTRERLVELAPETDLKAVLLLSPDVKPIDADEWEDELLLWMCLTGAGAVLILVDVAWAALLRRSAA